MISFPVVGYHGCHAEIAQSIVSNEIKFKESENDYDWLGPGIYFWVGSYSRAADWARQHHGTSGGVVGAIIDLGHCLNLTDFGVSHQLRTAHRDLSTLFTIANVKMPRNFGGPDQHVPLVRKLDCAVIQQVHAYRHNIGADGYDTVLGAFDEGEPAYDGGAIYEKSHIQIAVRNPNCIGATFLPNVAEKSSLINRIATQPAKDAGRQPLL